MLGSNLSKEEIQQDSFFLSVSVNYHQVVGPEGNLLPCSSRLSNSSADIAHVSAPLLPVPPLDLQLFHPHQGCIIRSILPSGMGAHGVRSEQVENMEMFSCSPAYICRRSDVHIKIFIACWFKGCQEQFFSLQTLLFTAFLVTVLKMLTYALVSTWPLVSSGWEHVKRKCTPDPHYHNCFLVF